MAAVLKHWREAATLLLVTRKQSGKNVKFQPLNSTNTTQKINTNKTALVGLMGDNLDVLLLKRSSKSRFMPSVYVFPGGVASDADFSADWRSYFLRVNSDLALNTFKYVQKGGVDCPMFNRERDPQFCYIPSELAFRICAIRETFEESGVLLARKIADLKDITADFMAKSPILGTPIHNEKDILEYWRKEVYADPSKFLAMCKELKIIPDVWCLYEWSNWLTPTGLDSFSKKSGRRFDTAFFMACVPEKPEAMHDEGETVHLQWGSPKDVLYEYAHNQAQIAPPQLYELSRLFNFADINHLHEFVWKRELQGLIRYFPIQIKCQDAYLSVLPGDGLYPKEPNVETGNQVDEREETLAELKKKFPKQHRTYLSD
ncbi:hypothetical protein LOTGIDRAFT_191687, partial [Lottia gigantea]